MGMAKFFLERRFTRVHVFNILLVRLLATERSCQYCAFFVLNDRALPMEFRLAGAAHRCIPACGHAAGTSRPTGHLSFSFQYATHEQSVSRAVRYTGVDGKDTHPVGIAYPFFGYLLESKGAFSF